MRGFNCPLCKRSPVDRSATDAMDDHTIPGRTQMCPASGHTPEQARTMVLPPPYPPYRPGSGGATPPSVPGVAVPATDGPPLGFGPGREPEDPDDPKWQAGGRDEEEVDPDPGVGRPAGGYTAPGLDKPSTPTGWIAPGAVGGQMSIADVKALISAATQQAQNEAVPAIVAAKDRLQEAGSALAQAAAGSGHESVAAAQGAWDQADVALQDAINAIMQGIEVVETYSAGL